MSADQKLIHFDGQIERDIGSRRRRRLGLRRRIRVAHRQDRNALRQLVGNLQVRAEHAHRALHGQVALRLAGDGHVRIEALGQHIICCERRILRGEREVDRHRRGKSDGARAADGPGSGLRGEPGEPDALAVRLDGSGDRPQVESKLVVLRLAARELCAPGKPWRRRSAGHAPIQVQPASHAASTGRHQRLDHAEIDQARGPQVERTAGRNGRGAGHREIGTACRQPRVDVSGTTGQRRLSSKVGGRDRSTRATAQLHAARIEPDRAVGPRRCAGEARIG